MKISALKFGLMASLLLVSFFSIPANAQWGGYQYPNSGISRFRWEGIVDGTSFVRIRGRNVQVETRSGLPVQRQNYNFSDPLPRAAVELGLNVFNGRGRVRLVQYPRVDNDFTAVVRIDDNSGGRDVYGFELQWYDRNWRDNGGGWSGTNPRNTDGVTWRGRVDGESIIRFRGDQAWAETINGYGVSNVRYNFSSPLPRNSRAVSLIHSEGRGQVLIVEQPSRGNDYTAVIVVRDRQGGAGNYAFTLTWEKPRYRDDDNWGGRPDGSRSRGLRWSGRVDGSDVIFIRGNQLWIDHRSGQQIYDESHRFFQSLPGGREFVNVRKIEGRGLVRVIEQPSRSNNYTAAILIDDRDGGADRYEIEVEW
ncbi:MAG: hypothetical protein JMDDDDMK_05665 [Acidobacteria bacterium]|nr:hypothetical protein [Acidobacteriota bacterium]